MLWQFGYHFTGIESGVELGLISYGEQVLAYAKSLLTKGKREIRVLTVGRVGHGKSALINTLFGKDVAREDDCAQSVTCEVTCHTLEKHDVMVTIADTPGFFDNTQGKSTLQILEGIEQKMPEVDLILFCMKMTERFSSTEENLIKIITKAYGKSVWGNTIFALTFANNVAIPRRKSNIDLPTHFTKKLKELKEIALSTVENIAKIDPKEIPVLPVGSDDLALPHTADWFTPFWCYCFKRTNDRAKPAFLKMCIHQLLSNTTETPEAPLDDVTFLLEPDLSEIESVMSEQENMSSDENGQYWFSIIKRIIEFFKSLKK